MLSDAVKKQLGSRVPQLDAMAHRVVDDHGAIVHAICKGATTAQEDKVMSTLYKAALLAQGMVARECTPGRAGMEVLPAPGPRRIIQKLGEWGVVLVSVDQAGCVTTLRPTPAASAHRSFAVA